jgi:alkylation response protein AidB-like acyl-CoA dehydrogenase
MAIGTTTRIPAAGHLGGAGLDPETLNLMLGSLREFVDAKLPMDRRLQLDHQDVCPEYTVRAMCGDQLGVQLVFIPEEYGGLGGGAFDSYRVCECLARIDIGLATSVFATAQGSDPILVGATEEQRSDWLGRIAERGVLFAYRATEPEAGSDLDALRTTATPVRDGGVITGYRLNGRKQWISNGGIADLGGIPVCLLGVESRTLPRHGFVPADGPQHWSSGLAHDCERMVMAGGKR